MLAQWVNVMLILGFWKSRKVSSPEAVSRSCCVLKGFCKIHRKHLCRSLFLNKFPGLGPAIPLKRRPRYRCFLKKFVKCLRSPFCIKRLRWPCHQLKNKFRRLSFFPLILRYLAEVKDVQNWFIPALYFLLLQRRW